MNQKWVALQQWTYKTEISGYDLNQLFSNNEEEALLKLSTVGTISKVYLNGVKIGATDNIFRTFYFPITKAMIKDQNTLSFAIDSTLRYTYQQHAAYKGHKYNEDLAPYMTIQKSYISFARTQAMDFGWDWSLTVAP
jgi:beta-mannosidase